MAVIEINSLKIFTVQSEMHMDFIGIFRCYIYIAIDVCFIKKKSKPRKCFYTVKYLSIWTL